MFRSLLITFFILCSFANASTLRDTAITKSVQKALNLEAKITSANIEVFTKEKIVTLTGAVDTSFQANRITEIVSSIDAVKDVNTDDLEVKSSKEFLSDAYITAKVKGKIKYLAISGKILPEYSLHVETTNKVVHIFGEVKRGQDSKTIEDSMQNIIDVENVMMHVQVK